VEIDDLQRAASRVIARATGAEAGCVTSSASSGIAVCVAAAMTGADLARIVRLPDTEGLRNEVILQHAHDVNFGARISQMARLPGAQVVSIGTANHSDAFHLRGAITPRTAAVLFVANSAVSSAGDFLPLDRVVEIASRSGIPVIVDAAAEPDLRPFVHAGASLVITSGHKAMGAPTSGLICGRKDLVRACYLQNWGIGRAMKIGKEGIAGLMAAVERWYSRDAEAESRCYQEIARVLAASLPIVAAGAAHRVAVDISQFELTLDPRQWANLLRESDPPIWIHDISGGRLVLDLRALDIEAAHRVIDRVNEIRSNPSLPVEDVPYHDLYYSEERLLRWPD
jgi:uncharacterized pyridoxal phosphate-dependent enzyme